MERISKKFYEPQPTPVSLDILGKWTVLSLCSGKAVAVLNFRSTYSRRVSIYFLLCLWPRSVPDPNFGDSIVCVSLNSLDWVLSLIVIKFIGLVANLSMGPKVIVCLIFYFCVTSLILGTILAYRSDLFQLFAVWYGDYYITGLGKAYVL